MHLHYTTLWIFTIQPKDEAQSCQKHHDRDSNPHSTDQKHQSPSQVRLTAQPRHKWPPQFISLFSASTQSAKFQRLPAVGYGPETAESHSEQRGHPYKFLEKTIKPSAQNNNLCVLILIIIIVVFYIEFYTTKGRL